MPQNLKQKLYCYVDETGQDPTSDVFIVVVIITADDQEILRQALIEIEREARTSDRKWFNLRPERRLHYIDLILENEIASGDIFFGVFKKPTSFFLPFVQVLESGIIIKSHLPYTARIFVDGIDAKKATELTMALRTKGISLRLARTRRDESEPLIRLADMWAGCIRAALLDSQEERALLNRAMKLGHVHKLDL